MDSVGKKGPGPIKFPKMHLKMSKARGTKQSSEVVEALQESWPQVKEKFNGMKPDE